jgi:DNA-binding CsgD family transcriptional regulator
MRSEACLAFIARCEAETDVSPLVEEFLRLVRVFGFNACAGGSWAGVGKARQHRFFFNDWPKDWLVFYEERGFFHRDFIVAESRRQMRPFLWNEVDKRLFTSKTAREFFDATRLWGWRDGFVVPIRGPGGHEGIVSLAASQSIVLDGVERALLEAASRVIHEKCRRTIGYGVGLAPYPEMSPRELECAQWVAIGKTDWEIGELLGISKATAHYHIESAKRKLGVNSRTQMIALLALRGIL